MTRNAARAVLITACLCGAAAPAASAATWSVGLKGGLNLATFRGDFDDVVGFESRTGLAAGGFVVFQATPVVGLQMEAIYTQKGAKRESEGADDQGNPTGTQTDLWKLEYLEIPLLARFVILPSSRTTPYIVAGPAFGISLRGRFDSGFLQGSEIELEDMKAVDVGLVGGIGLETGAGPYRVALEGRYTGGSSDVYDIDGNLESINSVFTFGVAVTR